ncbi:MAG TPA: methionyl-tRNA formyltransferase [Gemmatimonadaceae bacterium]|nr:methionyl-tRNA formyltransferase [Gemmatimonadaceae bacterium]
MRLVFCGTPQFAVPTLEALASGGHEIALVVTQPDRPRGRGMELAHSPVKQSALKLGLAITQPERIKTNAEFQSQLEAIHPEAIVVVGYGRIIPRWMLDLPRHGNLNVHASLLPKYRGAAPIQWAIASGEQITGVTTMHLDEGLDTGDILLQAELPIALDDTSMTLAPKLASIGAELMLDTLRGLQDGSLLPRPQDHAHHSLAPILKKEDGLVDFSRTADEIANRLRGFQPWPGAFSTFRGKSVTFHSVRPLTSGVAVLAPGEIAVQCDTLLTGCGEGTSVEVFELQLEGKRRMQARDFLHGYQPKPREAFGAPGS